MGTTKSVTKRIEPVKESQHTRALRRFFPEGRGRIEGNIVPGFFGPDSPGMREEGRTANRWMMGGLFCVFTWDVWTFSGSKRVNPIHGYSIVGWDSLDGEYRMLRAANLGVMHQLNGKLDGNRLAFVSRETMVKGKPTKVRYTFVRKRAKVIVWITELSISGGPWISASEDTLIYS